MGTSMPASFFFLLTDFKAYFNSSKNGSPLLTLSSLSAVSSFSGLFNGTRQTNNRLWWQHHSITPFPPYLLVEGFDLGPLFCLDFSSSKKLMPLPSPALLAGLGGTQDAPLPGILERFFWSSAWQGTQLHSWVQRSRKTKSFNRMNLPKMKEEHLLPV